MKLNPNLSLNPDAPKICLLDIDGVVVDFEEPCKLKEGVLEKVKKLEEEGWIIVAFTTRDVLSLIPLVEQGLPIKAHIPKPWAREIMIVDDILSEARNEL